MREFTCIGTFIILVSWNMILHARHPEAVDWQYDIDLLERELAEKHPDLFRGKDSASFHHALERVAGRACNGSLFDVSVQLQQVLAGLGDPYTAVNYHYLIRSEAILPLVCVWFEEGIFVMETSETCSRIVGKKLVTVNEAPIAQVIDSLTTLLVPQNVSLIKAETERMLSWAQLLQYFGFAGQDGVHMGFEDTDGNPDRVFFPLPTRNAHAVRLDPVSVPEGWKDRKAYFRDRYFPEEQLYYIQYNHCWSREVEVRHGSGSAALFMPVFRDFERRVFRHIRREKIEKLVIDLRFNEGGVASQGTAFIDKLSRSRLNGKGKIYVILGRHTFSTAVIHAVELIRMTDAITVGEPTGGRPNHFGEIRRFVLPETGLVVSHPTRFFQLMESDPPTLQPDIDVTLYYRDYMKGVDAFLQAVKDHRAD